MARYEIVIDDEDRDEQPFIPWNATLNGVLQSGKGSEILASGFGSTPREAVERPCLRTSSRMTTRRTGHRPW